MTPLLVEAVLALLRAGPSAPEATQKSAGAALAFLVHAPTAHAPEELWHLLPPLATLLELLPLCAQLRRPPEAPPERQPLLLLALKLLAALASWCGVRAFWKVQRCLASWQIAVLAILLNPRSTLLRGILLAALPSRAVTVVFRQSCR